MNMHFHAQPGYPPVYNFQVNDMPYHENPYPVHASFPGFQYMFGYQQPRSHLMADRNVLADPKAESKPRLSKEEVEKLEKVFKANPKPSSSIKAQLADSLGLERPRINNWFQNRRAKAKQERKQREYEERRAKEKASSEADSPGVSPRSESSDQTGESAPQRAQPSSALFPSIGSADQATTDDAFDNEDLDDGSADSDTSDSHSVQDLPSNSQDGHSVNFQSPLSFDYPPTDVTDFTRAAHQDYAPANPLLVLGPCNTEFSPRGEHQMSSANGLPSPNEQGTTGEDPSCQYPVGESGFSTAAVTPFTHSQPTFDTPGYAGNGVGPIQGHGQNASTPAGEGRGTALVRQGIATPSDSFKSPPPPANIASRRNIPRPASLQTASLRSRSFNMGSGSKGGLDSSVPGSAIRRIVSTASNHGRVQKSGSVPRSPMFFNNRNPENLMLHYQNRSPVIPVSGAFSGVTPPTPMTPAIVEKQGIREATMSSLCSDDSFFLGGNLSVSSMSDFNVESNLKTPPDTPGMLAQLGNHNYPSNMLSQVINYPADQPIFTPSLEAEFHDLGMHSVPIFTESSEESLPSTPLYPNMMNCIQEQNAFAHNPIGNTQFDWDANESVNSSKPSPNQPRSKLIQFTQNMTPQDYTTHLEK